MINFYEVRPLDTLFFRGSTPMEAGQYNTVSLFPPPLSVIKGAFWTEYCNKNNIPYSQNLNNGEIPITVCGFFIKKNNKLYAPSPATWYLDSDKKINTATELNNSSMSIVKAVERKEEFSTLGISSSAGKLVFVTPKIDAKPLTNCYLSVDFIKSGKTEITKDDILFPLDIYTMENRTGNGLDSNKHTIDGALYTSTHIRLNEDISIVVALDSDMNLENGKFIFGGEKRLSEYIKIADSKIFQNEDKENSQYLSLAPIIATEDTLSHVISSQKLVTISGWDLQKKFHKPSVSYIPSGAVFNKNIEKSCIPMV